MDWTQFTHLLATNYPPSTDEAKEINALLTAHTTQLSELDTKISRLSSIIDDLKAKRSKLNDDIIAGQAMVAPFRRVPQEILQEIFIHCLPTQHNAIMSPNEAPLLFGQVCRLWREVSAATSDLWSSIHIAIPDKPDHWEYDSHGQMSSFLEAVGTWLGRSGGAPLSVSLFSPFSSIPKAGEQVLSMLMPFSDRWKHISILGALEPFSSLASLSKESVPLLESFCAYYENEASRGFYQIHGPTPSDLYRAPLLRVIATSFTSAIPQGPCLAQLTSLVIGSNGHGNTHLEPPYALEILRQCPNIVKCRLWLTGRLPGGSPSRHGKFSLPLLENLIVGGLHADLTYFFNHLNLPNLINLECSERFHKQGLPWPFLDCLSRSNTDRLRGAKITSLSPTRDNIENFLSSAPSLARFCYEARLDAGDDLFDDDILSLFMPTTLGLSPCPRLKGLEIYYGSISDKALLDFIRARTINASAFDVDYLESVCVQFERTQELDIVSELFPEILARTQVNLIYEEVPKQSLPSLEFAPRAGIDNLTQLQYDAHPSLIPPDIRPSWGIFPSPKHTRKRDRRRISILAYPQ